MKSISEQDFLRLIDRFLSAEMSDQEKESFLSLCASDPAYSALFQQYQTLLQQLEFNEEKRAFKSALSQAEIQNEKLSENNTSTPLTKKIYTLWDRLRLNVGVAAAVAIISAFGTLLFSGYFTKINKATTDYHELRREMNTVKRNVNAQNAVIKNINQDKPKSGSHSTSYGATGFLLTNDGYVVTNYHVVHGADSIHLQNSKGNSYKAEVIFSDEAKDLAILYINDIDFKYSKSIPYSFKTAKSDLGEDIFTIGFPRDEVVYGQGYLSSSTGYMGDTVAYQISIPVNPGNSGGPVLDQKGNIIGIISGKQKGTDGVAFAIKTNTLFDLIEMIPSDSMKGKIHLNSQKHNVLTNLSRTEQIKKIKDFVFLVKVY